MSQKDSLLEIYIYENLQLLDKMEALLLAAEKKGEFSQEDVDAIFRTLHTVKGSSAMMEFEDLKKVSHAMEDLFGLIREGKAYDHKTVFDLVFEAGDFLKSQIGRLQEGQAFDGDPQELLERISGYYSELKQGQPENTSTGSTAEEKPAAEATEEQKQAAEPAEQETADGIRFYKAHITFQPDSKMENIRAFGVVKSIENLATRIKTIPSDVFAESSQQIIAANGVTLFIESDRDGAVIKQAIDKNLLLENVDFAELEDITGTPLDRRTKAKKSNNVDMASVHNYMSVRLDRLDKLMNLVGELVITQSTVINNPEVLKLNIDSFEKASRQLKKLTDELQDTVMSIRMLPLSATFLKLERTVRDICRKTGKKAELSMSGEETELDKNIIDNLSDPLMHIIRNAIDHGIEPEEERKAAGKPAAGKITIDAHSVGGDVLITISDDGRGLDKNELIKKGVERGLITKPPEEVTDKEAYNLIFLPGFSTRDAVTEFSGRGVGMDVVLNNIHLMGGSLSVDSKKGQGMSVQIRIPLTLVILGGMLIEVGGNTFIVPVSNIVHSFKPRKNNIIVNPDGSEMAIVDDQCYNIVRLHKVFGIDGAAEEFEQGMLMRVESGKISYCLFIDRLIGEQQIVIKPMPFFITKALGSIKGILGCTILGDGSVSLIIDINSLAA